MKKINKETNKEDKKKSAKFTLNELIIIVVIFSLISSALTGALVYLVKDKGLLEEKPLKDIMSSYKKINNNYYKKINTQELADSAIDGMLNYLDEKYSVYMDEESKNELEEKLMGEYQGIGVQITKQDKDIVIVTVFESSPAKKAGLKAGDVIKKVDDLEVKEDTELTAVVGKVKGSLKTKITVLRGEELKEFDIQVKTLNVPVVETKTFEKNGKIIGYIYLSSFSSTADKQVSEALKKLEKLKIDSLIFDVRSNTGGYLNIAESIIQKFLKKDKPMYQLKTNKKNKIYYDKTNEKRDYPVTVLIDRKSASASEILASAFKESYGSVIIGTTSYGKGLVQETSELSDKTMIKYTTAKWLTPNGNSLDNIGLKPGIEVTLTEKYANNPTDENDTQLQKAIEFLANED